ncbi:MAG: hypothetical protein ACT4PJ_13930 [Gemmatimonadaceae bacterium]
MLEGEISVDRAIALASPTDERPTVRVRDERPRWARVLRWVMASRTRMVKTAAAAALAVTVSAYSGHVAIMHRSRCPSVELTDGGSLTLMVDAVTSNDQGDALDVYYDVCGLEAGTPYHVDVVVGGQGGLRRLLSGGSRPVKVSYDEVADGPRDRYHRSVDVSELPAGTYSLTVTFSDGDGRTRERRQEFRVTQ